jgi:hypothetical protein
LKDRAALAADIAEIGAAGLPPDFVGFQQRDRQKAAEQPMIPPPMMATSLAMASWFMTAP